MRSTDTKRALKRRRVVSAIGAAGLAFGGLSTSAAAKGNENASGRGNGNGNGNGNGKTPLVDGPVDLLVFWSSGEAPNDFNYRAAVDDLDFDYPPTEDSTRGLFFPGHDPEGGGLLDYERFELSPNGNTLHNDFELFQGALNAGKSKPYPLVHQGNGEFESRGQVLNFDVPPYEETLFGQMGIPIGMLPPIEILADDSWRAVGTDVAKLLTDENGTPIQIGEWGVTRVDVYSHGGGKPEYELSLLYLIWGAKDPTRTEPTPEQLIEDIPGNADSAARELIDAGLLNTGGQPRGR